MEPTADEKTFDQNLTELETLVRRLDSGEMPLEEALAAFERGVGLVRQLHTVLNQAEQRVEVLTRDREGALRLDPAPKRKGNE
jgi:exodeoxyribonuclease VII small subunit